MNDFNILVTVQQQSIWSRLTCSEAAPSSCQLSVRQSRSSDAGGKSRSHLPMRLLGKHWLLVNTVQWSMLCDTQQLFVSKRDQPMPFRMSLTAVLTFQVFFNTQGNKKLYYLKIRVSLSVKLSVCNNTSLFTTRIIIGLPPITLEVKYFLNGALIQRYCDLYCNRNKLNTIYVFN